METFWPPAPEEAARWRRQLSYLLLVVSALVLTAPAGWLLWCSLPRLAAPGFDLVAHMEGLLVPVAVAAALALIFALGLPCLLYRQVGEDIRLAAALAEGALEEGETLQTLCPAMFLGRVLRGGFLLLTDRRLVRLRVTFTGFRQATLSRWVNLAAIDLTTRRANRHPVFGVLLGLGQASQGLTLTTREGESHFLAINTLFLRPLCESIRGRGHEIGFRNDEDLSARPRTSAIEFEERRVASQMRRSLRLTGLLLVTPVLAIALVFALEWLTR